MGAAGEKPPRQRLGRYAIYSEIASGGMATVHLARLEGPEGFSRVVAAKRLHTHLFRDDEFKQMFLDEARFASRIRHPNVVPVLDVVVGDDELLLVMEYVHGESLLTLLRESSHRKSAVPTAISATIMASVLHGLHAAHEARNEKGEPLGIVHRDVSPHNILVGADGVTRVLDFGVAKAMQARQDTNPGTLKGKFSYMAPEVLHGERPTRQADIFSASIVLWELITGRKLFAGTSPQARMLKILSGDYPSPSSLTPELNPTLDRIVMKGLSRDTSTRYSTAREMALDLENHLALASQGSVGEWVVGLISESLERRSELLREIETSMIATIPPPSDGPSTLRSGFSETIVGPLSVSRRTRATQLGFVAVAVAVIGGASLMLGRSAGSSRGRGATAGLGGDVVATPTLTAPASSPDSGPTEQSNTDPRGVEPTGSESKEVVKVPAQRTLPSTRHPATKAPTTGSGSKKDFLPNDL
jgi:serine/threonine-protein kinase